MPTFKIEVDNAKKYSILKQIQNYYSDFISNPMAREDEVKTINKIINEIFSEERNGFNHFVVEHFTDEEIEEDSLEIDYDVLKSLYDSYLLEQTNALPIEEARWLCEKGKNR